MNEAAEKVALHGSLDGVDYINDQISRTCAPLLRTGDIHQAETSNLGQVWTTWNPRMSKADRKTAYKKKMKMPFVLRVIFPFSISRPQINQLFSFLFE